MLAVTEKKSRYTAPYRYRLKGLREDYVYRVSARRQNNCAEFVPFCASGALLNNGKIMLGDFCRIGPIGKFKFRRVADLRIGKTNLKRRDISAVARARLKMKFGACVLSPTINKSYGKTSPRLNRPRACFFGFSRPESIVFKKF